MLSSNEQFVAFGAELLIQHSRNNDPHIDNYPLAREESKKHRETCRICKFIDSHPNMFKRFVEDRSTMGKVR